MNLAFFAEGLTLGIFHSQDDTNTVWDRTAAAGAGAWVSAPAATEYTVGMINLPTHVGQRTKHIYHVPEAMIASGEPWVLAVYNRAPVPTPEDLPLGSIYRDARQPGGVF